jgi:hypothetical protein
MLVLFSIGMTKGKWGTLLDGLLGFKRAYDHNTPLRDAPPRLAAAHPERYGTLGLADLCDEMHHALRTERMPALLDSAFDALPEAKLSPADAYRRLVRGRTERLSLAAMRDRTATVMVVPYPPGIPILMPGESSGPADGPLLQYLSALEAFDKRFPGFEHDIHGVQTRHQRALRDRMPRTRHATRCSQRLPRGRPEGADRSRIAAPIRAAVRRSRRRCRRAATLLHTTESTGRWTGCLRSRTSSRSRCTSEVVGGRGVGPEAGGEVADPDDRASESRTPVIQASGTGPLRVRSCRVE